MKIIERWWTKWSVQLLLVLGGIAELLPYLPDLQQALPVFWYQWAFRAILIARIIQQKTSDHKDLDK